MKNKNKLSDIWAVYLVIALLTLIMVLGVANATPTSRIVAEPEWLAPGEEDDGKFAMMINKGLLCDKDSVIFTRYMSEGYQKAFRGINKSGMYTYILIKSNQTQDGKWIMNKILILEVDSISKVACVVSENSSPEFNSNFLYLELYPIPGETL
tara:strand:- start:3239 stop:3697 length:459 start_codon:yes stop_codon:yes gene_type:complete